MPSLLHIVTRAFRVWWDELVIMLLLNVVWFLLQIPVITGPPATAMVYAMALRSKEGVYWGPRDAWEAFRELFWPAWRWGLGNALVCGVGLWNLVTYWQTAGGVWLVLRLLWIAVLTVWMALNLFYWPFWLAQEDRSLINTYRNCSRFLLLHPGLALVLVIFAATLAAVSLVLTLPFTLALMCWMALIGLGAVSYSLTTQEAARP